MKIALLSRNKELYSSKRLIEAAKEREHDIIVLDALRCYMNIATDKPTMHYRGEEVQGVDAIIPRIGASVSFYGTAVVRQFEMMNTYSLNKSLGITRSRDKLHCMQLLSSRGIGLPETGIANRPGDVKDLLKIAGGTPLVIKLLEGTQGIGVVLAETRKAAESVIEAFMGIRANLLVQEYIKEAEGCDIRCLVLGGKVIAAMERKAPKGEFRSNLHRGGASNSVRLSVQERNMAIRAAKIVGLNFAGVDILRSDNGPVVIEINSSPGLEGIEKQTKKDIAGEVISYIEENVIPRKIG
ncbi:MAG: Ribosomal protein S6 glutaminyl transferase [uncultured Thiotrichaceae bacterium]|uniref:Probable alpha-L-glutamate ligase n=1 Tax=uncultured Thiotrichaceae bacterium TaxID=298394 RepID=A0A6S6U7C1_9GAMM|nr:MAG: Ribosomal protein S6 glutaminyl transferase [uncultured Thiotrichaceae bacterium]